MTRFKKMTGLLVLLGFCAGVMSAQAQLQVAGNLLVSVTANEFTTGSSTYSWTNNGTLGGTFDVVGPYSDTVTTGQAALVLPFDNTRGLWFHNDIAGSTAAPPMAMRFSRQAPAQILGNGAWTVEYWAWAVEQNGGNARPLVGWGDRPNFVNEFDYASPAALEYVSYDNGDHSWSNLPAARPLLNKWQYVVFAYDPATSLTVYLNGVRAYDGNMTRRTTGTGAGSFSYNGPWRSSWMQSVFGETSIGGGIPAWLPFIAPAPGSSLFRIHGISGTTTPNPNNDDPTSAPISIGAIRQRNGADGGTSTWSGTYPNNGTNQFTAPINAGIARVRIMDGTLDTSQVLNNYNFEVGEFGPRSGAFIHWLSPVSAKVLEFGTSAPPTSPTLTKHVTFKNVGTAAFTVNSYAIAGPDAALYSFSTVPTTGSLAANTKKDLLVNFNPVNGNETSATLTVNTALGTFNIWLRANVGRIYVATTGNDTTGDGSSANPYKTLVKAIGVAKSGGVIEMAPGFYTGTTITSFAEGDRQVRITAGTGGPVTLSTAGLSPFQFTSSFTKVLGFPPGPSLVDAANNTTLTFENITIDSRGSGNGLGGLVLAGNGTFEVNFNNCVVYNQFGNAALYNTSALAGYVHYSANNTVFAGSVSPSNFHDGVRINSLLGDAEFTNCDFRGNLIGVRFAPAGINGIDDRAKGGEARFTNCLFAGVPNQNNTSGISVVSGGIAAPGTTVYATNCRFDNFSSNAYLSNGALSSLIAKNCTFTNSVGTSNLYWITNGTAYPAGRATSALTDCVFSNPGQIRAIRFDTGQDLRLVNCQFAGPFTNNTILHTGTGVPGDQLANNTTSGTLQLINCSGVDGGTSSSGSLTVNNATDATRINNVVAFAGAALTIPKRSMNIFIDRSTLTGGKLIDTSTPPVGAPKRTPVLMAYRPTRINITNSVIEGSDYAVRVTPWANAASNRILLYNNTIIHTADSLTSFVLSCDATANTADLANNIMLGWASTTLTTNTTNLATGQLTTARKYIVTGDPRFVRPNPIAVPAGTNLSDYHLTRASALAIGTGTDLTAQGVLFDRQGAARVAPYDIGAYAWTGGPNETKSWWTMF